MSRTVERPGDPNADEARVEYATARPAGSGSPFPPEWGPPGGQHGSDERREWIKNHVGSDLDVQLRRMAKRDAALTVALRRAELLARE